MSLGGHRLLDAPPPDDWRQAAAYLWNPAPASALDEAGFSSLVGRLSDLGVAPLFVHSLKETGARGALHDKSRALCAKVEARAKASHLALMAGLERVLEGWEGRVTVPFALKGLHLAAAYYPAQYLRPMADADILFEDLAEGERAWALARDLGLVPQAVPLASDPWIGAHELPMLVDPASGFTLEIQGSLVFSTRDRRWLRAKHLLAEPLRVDVAGHDLMGLRPEANLVYLLAHNFVQHAASGPKFHPLVDTAMILRREEGALDWRLLVEWATSAGLAGPAALGLAWSRDLLGAAVPSDVLAELAEAGGDFAPPQGGRGPSQDALTLDEVCSQATAGDMARLLWSRVCPSGAYMRHRYPGRGGWPLFLLYPARWWEQFRRGMRALVSRKRQR
jgi:hypothetical protein